MILPRANNWTHPSILVQLNIRFNNILLNLIFRAFTSLCYSADGTCILAGGRSKNICIYNVQESILLKKYEITQNRSLDAVDVSNNV